jgi:hypothetical protein
VRAFEDVYAIASSLRRRLAVAMRERASFTPTRLSCVSNHRFLAAAQVNLAILRQRGPSEPFVALVPRCAASNQDKRRNLLGYFEKSGKKEEKKEKKEVKRQKKKKEVKKAEEQLKNQQAAQGVSQAKPVFVVKKFEEEKPWRRNLLGYLKEKKEKKKVEVKKVEAQPENQQAAQGIAQAKPVFVVKKVKEEKPWRRSLLGYFTALEKV